MRIKIWIDERRNQGKLYHGKKTITIDKKTSYAYEGDIDVQNELACGYGISKRSDGATYTGMFYMDKYHGIGVHKFHGEVYAGEWKLMTKHGKFTRYT